MTITVRLIEAQRILGVINLRGQIEDRQLVSTGFDTESAKRNMASILKSLHGKETTIRFKYAKVSHSTAE